jgi:8-oxo-dGTP pyrophosphatase MutT (NUDIX family)
MMIQPLDNRSPRFPVSVKGVLLRDGRVVLVGNSRGEWELPGGKLEPAETPEACVAREIAEELDVQVSVGPLLDAWVYHIAEGVDVLVLAYGCTPAALPERLESPEGRAVGLFAPDALDGIPLPHGYRRAIDAWVASARAGS